MRKNTQKLTKPDAKNSDLGIHFRIHVPPICCQHDVFLRPGARNLPMGGPRCDSHGMLAEFGCHVGDIWDLMLINL